MTQKALNGPAIVSVGLTHGRPPIFPKIGATEGPKLAYQKAMGWVWGPQWRQKHQQPLGKTQPFLIIFTSGKDGLRTSLQMLTQALLGDKPLNF